MLYLKKAIDKFLNINIFKVTFTIACLFYVFPFTSFVMSRVLKIFFVWLFTIFLYDLKVKKLAYNKVDYLLIILIIIGFVGCIVNYKNNFILNIISILYMYLFTVCMQLYNKKDNIFDLKKELIILSKSIIFFTSIFTIVSLVIFMCGYPDYLTINDKSFIVGIADGRLWSIYGNPNTFANFAIISIFFSLMLINISKTKKSTLIFNVLNILLQLSAVMLSNSRGSMVSFFPFLFIYFLFTNMNSRIINDKNKKIDFKKKIFAIFESIVYFSMVIIVCFMLESFSMHLKRWFSPKFTTFITETTIIPINKTDVNIDKKDLINKQNYETNLLYRDYDNENANDISNGRFEIWNAEMRVFAESPWFGVGIKNLNSRANKYMSEKTIKLVPKLSEDAHNIFIQFLATQGIIFTIIIIIYFIILIISYLKFIIKNIDNENINIFIILFCLFGIILVINLFDSNLLYFFSLFMVPIFWISINYMNRIILYINKESNDKKKILFLIDSLGGGGAEKVLVDITNNLDYDKYNIEVKTVYNEGIYVNELNKNIIYTTIVKKPNIWKKRVISQLIKLLPSRILYSLFISEIYDIEISFLEILSSKILSGSNSNAYKVSWIHSDMFESFGKNKLYYSKKNLIKCYQNYDKIVCVSDSTKNKFCESTGLYQDTITIYNPIDTRIIIEKSKERCELKKDNNKITMVSIGRLSNQKGYLRLLKVINKLKEEYSNFELWIIGDGEEKEKLVKYINNNKLNKYVKLIGFSKNPYKYLVKANLFISSSVTEGFGLVIGEAITLGVPVISTNTSGANSILENNKYGLIVDNSEDGLYNGLKEILTDNNKLDELKKKANLRKPFFELKNKMKQIDEILNFDNLEITDSKIFCTVFTPAYNRAYTLGKLYESLKKQTCNDFEWLVVDDGSKDETEKLFNKWTKEKNNFNINYIKVENGGKQRAINKGVKLAKGKMFFIVDSDDYLLENAIEKIVKYEKTISGKNKYAGLSFLRKYSNGNIIGKNLKKEYIDCLNSERNFYNLQGDKAEVYYKDILKRYPFPEIAGEKFVSENVVWNRISKDGYKIRWYNESIYVCDYLEDGLTSKGNKLYENNPKGYLIYIRNMVNYTNINLLNKFRLYCSYYDAVKNHKNFKDISIDLEISLLTLKIALFSKKVRCMLKGDKNA